MGQLHIFVLIFAASRYADGKGGGGSRATSTTEIGITEYGIPKLETKYSLTCSHKGLRVAGAIWEKGNNLLYVDYGLTWKKSGIQVFRRLTEVELVIPDVHLQDAGTYKCVIITENNVRHSLEKKVVIISETTIIKPGANHTLHCVDGPSHADKDLTSAVWIKGNEIISVNTTITVKHSHLHSNLSYYKLDAKRNLYIYRATSEHVGQYDCYLNGLKVNTITLAFPAPPPGEPPLSGLKGIAFGVALGVIIIALLGMAIYLQKTV